MISYMHGIKPDGTPAQVETPQKRPIIIHYGSFVGGLADIDLFMTMPLSRVRKIWRLMLRAAWDNHDAIDQIKSWLEKLPTNTQRAKQLQTLFKELTARYGVA